MKHLGNFTLAERRKPERPFDPAGQNVTDLSGYFDTSLYLTPHSDLVALMVLEHQTDALTTMIRGGFEVRVARHRLQSAMSDGSGDVEERQREFEETVSRAAGEVTDVLLFRGAPRLTAPIAGTSGFAKWFASAGPRDPQGRSLREFELTTRLFRYPVSYLIYSPTFAGLPERLRGEVLTRIRQEMTRGAEREAGGRLSEEERTAVLSILESTVPEFRSKQDGGVNRLSGTLR